jgi:hypothetical protein
MLLAFAVALGALSALHWRIRCVVAGTEDRGEELRATARGGVLSGVVTFLLGAGSVLLYLGSQPTVYHEAALWGIAFALCAYAAILDVQRRPSVGIVMGAGAFTALSLLSRVSVGIGPLVALGLVLATELVRMLRRRPDVAGAPAAAAPVRPAGSRGWVVGTLVAVCVVPVVLYAGVNMVKFGEPFRLPLEKQVFSRSDPNRIEALDANDGSLFNVGYLPTTLWQYGRPDAIELDESAPWINFPRSPTMIFRDSVFDTTDETSSVPASMPVWSALAVVGAIAIVRDAWRREWRLGVLVIPVVGAAAGTVGVLVIGFIANRYLGDLFPLAALLGLAGLHTIAGWWPEATAAKRVLATSGLAVLAIWGVAANLALAIEYQRVIAPVELETRWDFLRFQHGSTLEVDLVRWPPGPSDEQRAERGAIWAQVRVDELGDEVEDEGCRVLWSDGFNDYPVPGAVCGARDGDRVEVTLPG